MLSRHTVDRLLSLSWMKQSNINPNFPRTAKSLLFCQKLFYNLILCSTILANRPYRCGILIFLAPYSRCRCVLKKYQQLTITCMLIIKMKWFCWVININWEDVSHMKIQRNVSLVFASFCVCMHFYVVFVNTMIIM